VKVIVGLAARRRARRQQPQWSSADGFRTASYPVPGFECVRWLETKEPGYGRSASSMVTGEPKRRLCPHHGIIARQAPRREANTREPSTLSSGAWQGLGDTER
jgi:hypothetical protein